MIGLAKEQNGTYYTLGHQTSHPYIFFLSTTLSIKKKIWLQHCRLGHPSFRTLKIVFTSLFKKLDVESFHCNVCEPAKHKCSTFLTNDDKRSLEPFHLIHSYVWGPSPVPNISGAC